MGNKLYLLRGIADSVDNTVCVNIDVCMVAGVQEGHAIQIRTHSVCQRPTVGRQSVRNPGNYYLTNLSTQVLYMY